VPQAGATFLHDRVRVGNWLDLGVPAGSPLFDESQDPLLLVSTGAGITAVMAWLDHLSRAATQRDVIVAHADRIAEPALRDAVRRYGRDVDKLTTHFWYETVDSDDTSAFSGQMDLSRIELPPNVQAVVSGPFAFMRHTRSELLRRGIPGPAVRLDERSCDVCDLPQLTAAPREI
jgi:nitric oxide dioxygenase